MVAVSSSRNLPGAALARLEQRGPSLVLLAAACVIYASVSLYITRGTTLFVDELTLFTTDYGFHAHSLLAPLNGHLVLTQRLMFAIDFKLFGAHSFLLPRLVEVVGVLISVSLLFVLIAARVGRAAALCACVLMLFFGSAWELNLVPSGIGNVYAVAAGLGAVLALERRRDLLACILLTISVASFTLGVAFCAGALVLVALDRSWRRRVWLALVPLFLWAAWLLWIRATRTDGAQVMPANILLVPNLVAEEASSLMGALAGLNYNYRGGDFLAVFSTDSSYGPLLATGALGALYLRLRRGSVPPLLWALLFTLLVFWSELAVGFGAGRNPSTVRYTYAGAFMLLLVAAEAARGLRLGSRGRAAILIVVVLALGTNVIRLRDGGRVFRGLALPLRAHLTALELGRSYVRPGVTVPGNSLQVFDPRSYLAAVDRGGSPAFTPAELTHQSEDLRHEADVVSVALLAPRLSAAPRTTQPRACRRFAGSIPLGAGPVLLFSDQPARLGLRRYARAKATQLGALPAGQRYGLQIPGDRSSVPWVLTMAPTTHPLTICTA